MFVANRVAEVQSILPANHWHHVDGKENPADLISRGVSVNNLKHSEVWWSGPAWLSHRAKCEKRISEAVPVSGTDEQIMLAERGSGARVLVSVGSSENVRLAMLTEHSSLSGVERILAWMNRFIGNSRANSKDRAFGNLSLGELRRAHRSLIIAVQGLHFAEELSRLSSGKRIPASSNLLSADPFVDKEGVLRVGGRIENSSLSVTQKHPIILPSSSRFTRLLFERMHRRLLHAGPQNLLYAVRLRYWPISGRSIARKVVHDCVTCFRNVPRATAQIMGQLSADRVTPARLFFVSGVDFAGPITILLNRGRGRKTTKAYIALFICFATKAVHLEAVCDLSAAAFITTLRRFIGRRGHPRRIYCDNATNFVGAKNEVREIIQLIKSERENLEYECFIPNEIEWAFIPPSSPHIGGLWEAGIKSCKYHLKRVMGGSLMTFEELTTVLVQIESCLNSRPICQTSSDAADCQPLTPGHFLVGGALTALPDADVTEIPLNRLDRWQAVQRVVQHFWKRWSAEYLTSLQGRNKWKTAQANLVVGDIVLIHDANAPPLRWRLGKIKETHEGSDQRVRVVTIRMATGLTKRNITKICKLPINDEGK